VKVALTIWENRISPLFDSASQLLIADIEGRGIINKHIESFDCESAFSRAERLDGLGVDVLICGGISDFYADLIEARKIYIVPFATGDVEEALDNFINSNVQKK